ncbi:MAG: ATP-binding protein involved in chromosome partitioning [Kiritimatiellia bacterium]
MSDSPVDPLSIVHPAASKINDPVSGRTVWMAGMVQESTIKEGSLRFELWFSAEHSRDDRRSIEEALIANIKGAGFAGNVVVMAKIRKKPEPAPDPAPAPKKTLPGLHDKSGVAPHGGPIVQQPLDGVQQLICVASGKGGVGKSTVATNLAVGLAALGYSVGMLDADIYGPSLPTMMGVDESPMADADRKIIPVKAHGVSCLSIGMMVPKEQAIIWRGPMVMGALRQFIQDTRWGDLDYLIVDMPPGTGDAQLSLIQSVQLTGAIVVTTPQQVALDDAIRGVSMFQTLDVPLIGLVENMAWYELPDGSRDYVFGKEGGVRVAAKYDTEVLAQIPLQTRIRSQGDAGTPIVLTDSPVGQAFKALAARVAEKLPVSS